MSTSATPLLKHKALNEWGLFCLICIPMSAVMIVAMLGANIFTPSGVQHMIAFSVRWGVPLIYLVVAASSLQILFPGPLPMWLLRNRKYIGLSFAVAMAWQGLFIFIISTFFREYYFNNIFLIRDELEGSTGYLFLPAMVVTSFPAGRKYLNAKQWKLLHKSGIYFLWAYPFTVYWWNVFSAERPPGPIDYLFYWSGFLAFGLRILAWGKKRQQAVRKTPGKETPLAIKGLGGAIIACGLIAAFTGLHWQGPVSALLTSRQWSANLELWVPFWPFEPFISLLIIGLGIAVATTAKPALNKRELAVPGVN